MGYSTRFEFKQALANALTSANPDPNVLDNTIPITSIGSEISSTIAEEDIQQYIRWADENIDGWLRDVYRTPLKRVNRGSFPLAMDITAGDDFVIIADNTRFNEGDAILVRDSLKSQELIIDAIPNNTRMEFALPVSSSYLAVDTNIERIRYPDPIPKISARLAAAYYFDKQFSAQQEPNTSDYGKYLRRLVYIDINLITSGKIRLAVADACEYIGRRYYNLVLEDVPSSKAEPGGEWLKGEA